MEHREGSPGAGRMLCNERARGLYMTVLVYKKSSWPSGLNINHRIFDFYLFYKKQHASIRNSFHHASHQVQGCLC